MKCVICKRGVPKKKMSDPYGVYDDGLYLNRKRHDVLPDAPYVDGLNIDGFRFVHHECFYMKCVVPGCATELGTDSEGYKNFYAYYDVTIRKWVASCRRHKSVFTCRRCGGPSASEGVRSIVPGKHYYCDDHAPK